MAANQPPWPREWLMTDERMGDRLWNAIDALPAGAGIVFRHYSLAGEDRRSLGAKVAATGRRRDLLFAVAGDSRLAEELGASLVHNPDKPGSLPFSIAVHDERQAEAAREAGASLAFIAPICPTQSHPGAPHLGADRARELARVVGCPAIALGGMDAARFAELQAATSGAFYGYAGIDCWLR
jgi:thiamine-phosphate pyrophosphorylase